MTLPSISRLRELLVYLPDTGEILWATDRRCKKAGASAGHISKASGYLMIGIDLRVYYAHRVAWALHYGEWPTGIIDHINCNRSDNRIGNLRLANANENSRNRPLSRANTSGIKGVHWNHRAQKWHAQIKVNHKAIYLGMFDCKEEAARAYARAASVYHGEFARTA